MDSAIIERIKKLLALSESSNPHEAATAAEKARKMLLQYNLSSEEVLRHGQDKVQGRLWAKGLKETHWRVYLVATVFEHFFCQLITTPSGGWYIVGKSDNSEAAKVMLDYLLEELEKAVKEGDERRSAETTRLQAFYAELGIIGGDPSAAPSAVWAEDFRLGWSIAVCRRLLELKEKEKQTSTSEERALVLQEDQEVVDYLKSIGAQESPAPRPTGVSREAYIQGLKEGEAIPLNTMVEG